MKSEEKKPDFRVRKSITNMNMRWFSGMQSKFKKSGHPEQWDL
jgi:hypothetical protein